MVGYYRCETDNTEYHVYKKALDYYAECVKSEHKPINKPFLLKIEHLETNIKRGLWIKI